MMEFRDQMKMRSKHIALATIRLVDELPQKPATFLIAKQLLRCSTSIGANYRAAYRAKSTADFINKLKIVEEETDETLYWHEVLQESGFVNSDRAKKIAEEASEVLAIVVSSLKTARKRSNFSGN